MKIKEANLEGMSLDDLEELQKNVKKAITKVREREIREARDAVLQKARELGFTLEDLNLAGKPARKTRVSYPKYRNPDDVEQTWTGMGRRPLWLVKKLEDGHDVDEFLIPS